MSIYESFKAKTLLVDKKERGRFGWGEINGGNKMDKFFFYLMGLKWE
jgi:hypothetical protein